MKIIKIEITVSLSDEDIFPECKINFLGSFTNKLDKNLPFQWNSQLDIFKWNTHPVASEEHLIFFKLKIIIMCT